MADTLKSITRSSTSESYLDVVIAEYRKLFNVESVQFSATSSLFGGTTYHAHITYREKPFPCHLIK